MQQVSRLAVRSLPEVIQDAVTSTRLIAADGSEQVGVHSLHNQHHLVALHDNETLLSFYFRLYSILRLKVLISAPFRK